jgi:hypothetical protein
MYIFKLLIVLSVESCSGESSSMSDKICPWHSIHFDCAGSFVMIWESISSNISSKSFARESSNFTSVAFQFLDHMEPDKFQVQWTPQNWK